MKLQFKYMNGKILDIKRAFIFKINFDKEYLFYTTDDFKDGDMVSVIFGELIGPSMVKMSDEDKQVMEKFLFALANNRVDNISNYQLIKYEQLEVTILSGQKTTLPAYIVNKYSYNFEIVMPEHIDVISDPTPEIEPILEPIAIGNVTKVDKVNYVAVKDTNTKEVERKIKEIPTNVTLTPQIISDSQEQVVTQALADKVYEQLVNADSVDEAIDTLDMDAIPLKLNNETPIYVDKEVFNKALENVKNEPIIESIEESASKELKPVEKSKNHDVTNEISYRKKRGISFYFILVAYVVLLFGIAYFGSRWLEENHANDVLAEAGKKELVCETHLTNESTYRKVSSINDSFEDDEMIEHLNTVTLFFENESDYLAFKEEHNNDTIEESNGYRERYDYNDEQLTAVHVIYILKERMSLDEWVGRVGEATSYEDALSYYVNNGYICK